LRRTKSTGQVYWSDPRFMTLPHVRAGEGRKVTRRDENKRSDQFSVGQRCG